MTSRDFAFWIQGFFELSDHPYDANQDRFKLIREHAELALQTEPKSEFLRACLALSYNPSALHMIVKSRFEHVIDATMLDTGFDPAHPSGVTRC